MAKPLDVPFGAVLDRKSIKNLNMAELGGFILLAREAVLYGFEPFGARQSILCSRARCTAQQWTWYKKTVLEALRDALPVLQDTYSKAQRKRQNLQEHGRRAFAKSNAQRSLNAKQKGGAHNFTPSLNAIPVTFQPEKANKYRPENTDQALRTRVLAAMKDKPGTKRFTEKI